jgi:hypothetical protein
MSTTATAPAYTVAAMTPAERLGNRPEECQECGRGAHKTMTKLRETKTGGIIWAGGGCASILMFGRRDRVAAVINAAADANRRAEQDEDLRTERRARYTIALAAFEADDDNALFDTNARRTYFASGGFEALGSFPAWIARVAATGDLD